MFKYLGRTNDSLWRKNSCGYVDKSYSISLLCTCHLSKFSSISILLLLIICLFTQVENERIKKDLQDKTKKISELK